MKESYQFVNASHNSVHSTKRQNTAATTKKRTRTHNRASLTELMIVFVILNRTNDSAFIFDEHFFSTISGILFLFNSTTPTFYHLIYWLIVAFVVKFN